MLGYLNCWHFIFNFLDNIQLPRVCDRLINNSALFSFTIILLAGTSVRCIVSGSFAASRVLKNPKVNDKNNKCLKYISYGISGALKSATRNGKIADFTKLSNNLAKKAKSDSDEFNGYLCRDMCASTLTFVIVLRIGIK